MGGWALSVGIAGVLFSNTLCFAPVLLLIGCCLLPTNLQVNYRRTDNEPRGAMLRLVAAGGRATEGEGVGPLGTGVVALGTRTLSEAGTVGSWSREQVRGGSCAMMMPVRSVVG